MIYSENGTWSSTGNDLSINLPSAGTFPGYISSIDNQNMVWVTKQTNPECQRAGK